MGSRGGWVGDMGSRGQSEGGLGVVGVKGV